MGQSMGEQATEPSCRTQKMHKDLRSGQLMGHLGRAGHTAIECPSESPRSMVGPGEWGCSCRSVFPLEHKPYKVKALSTELICPQAPAEQIHELPKEGELQNPRRKKVPEAEAPRCTCL